MKPTSQHDRPSSSQLSIPSPTRSLEERLAARPGLRRRVEAILDVAERDGASGCTADEAEAHAIEQVRALGLELMQGWAAEATEVATKRVLASQPGTVRHGKKNFTGIRRSGASR